MWVCGFGRVRGCFGVSYGTESKRTESRAGRGGAGKFFSYGALSFHLSLLSLFLFLAFAGTGPGIHAFV